MCILHDIYLEDGDLNAQIDYMVVKPKINFIIECKNLYGNIEITANGDFIRTINYNSVISREGIYSPITQNQKHLDLLRRIRMSNKNFFVKFVGERFFEGWNQSIVVLANPKTVLDARNAPKDVREKVIRADQLINHIKQRYSLSKELAFSKKETIEWARSYLSYHKDVDKDYTKKYKPYRKAKHLKNTNSNYSTLGSVCITKVEDTEIFKELKHYRLIKSREENIKAYIIYNNNQLKDLISKMPRTKNELLKVDGFGESKVNKYGVDIITIINKY